MTVANLPTDAAAVPSKGGIRREALVSCATVATCLSVIIARSDLHSLLITDQPLVALGISQILAAIDTRMRVSMVASAQELFNALEEISDVPALVVVDLATGGLAVEQMFVELRRSIGRVPLVVLLDNADQVSGRALASAGATCVLKADSRCVAGSHRARAHVLAAISSACLDG